MEFYLGSENVSGIKTCNQDEFIQYILDAIEEAKQSGQRVFELEIIKNQRLLANGKEGKI